MIRKVCQSQLKNENEQLEKEIDLIKSDICKILKDNIEMKKMLEFLIEISEKHEVGNGFNVMSVVSKERMETD